MKPIDKEKFTLFSSKAASKSCKYNERLIHSAYNPLREAEKYLKLHNINTDQKIFILVFPGLDYLSEVLKKENNKVFSIHVSEFFAENKSISNDGHCLLSENIYEFLKQNISLFDVGALEVLLVEPLCSIFKSQSIYVSNIIKGCLQEIGSSRLTIRNFGKKWISNILLNSSEIKYKPELYINKPVLLLGSGPSVSKLKRYKNEINAGFTIFSFSSSYKIVKEMDIRPHYVFHTDPGHYADYYLPEIIKDGLTVIAPFTVKKGIFDKAPVFPLNTGLNIEKLLFCGSGNYPVIYDNGSVATTAVSFINKIGIRKIFISGIDLAYRDVLSHAKGHVHYSLLESNTIRKNPYLNILYRKKQLLAPVHLNSAPGTAGIVQYYTGPSLDIYANWFLNHNQNKMSITELQESESPRKIFESIQLNKAIHETQDSLHLKFPVLSDSQVFTDIYFDAIHHELNNSSSEFIINNKAEFTESTLTGELLSSADLKTYLDIIESEKDIKAKFNSMAEKLKKQLQSIRI